MKIYIDYDDYLGLLPELGASLVHGHWHGAGGSYTYEYSVFGLPEHKLLAYFDHSEPGYGALTWSFVEEDGSWYNGAAEGDSARYDALVRQYVYPALRVEDLASRCGLSYPWFAKKFREIYGVSCKDYIEQIRVARVEQLLLFTDYDLSRISEMTGYADCSHMIKNFKRIMEITPGQYRLKKKPE